MHHARLLAYQFLTLVTLAASSQIAHAQFVFDITQGGWVDEEAGLVWGYNVGCSRTASLNADYISAVLHAENYVQKLADAALRDEGLADAALATALEALDDGNLERYEFYIEQADYYYFRADKLFEASASIAPENVDGWRLPTLDEIEAAWSQGLFDIDRDPIMHPDYACYPYPNAELWTSTERGKSNYFWTFQPSTGDAFLVHRDGIATPYTVRSLNGDTGGGGPGNGNGNGNGNGKGK